MPYIDLDGSSQEAATMLMQVGVNGEHTALAQTKQTMVVETVREIFEGFTKKEISQAAAARQAQALIGNPRDKDYKQVVSSHLLSNCPVTHTKVCNCKACPSLNG